MRDVLPSLAVPFVACALALALASPAAAQAAAQGRAARLGPDDLAARVRLDSLVYATGAAASSTYGAGYEPTAATGRPDVWPRLADSRGAWAPRTQRTTEWLEVTFPPTQARAIYVFETNAPGAIRSVIDGSGTVLYETSEAPARYSRAQALVITLPAAVEITKLKIVVAGELVSGWAEIDGVGLGTTPPAEAPAAPTTPTPTPGATGDPASATAAAVRGRGEYLDAATFELRVDVDALEFANDARATPYRNQDWAMSSPDCWPELASGATSKVWAGPGTLKVWFPSTETRWIYVFETGDPGTVVRVADQDGNVLYTGAGETKGEPDRAKVLLVELERPATITKLEIEVKQGGSARPSIDAVGLGKTAPRAAPDPAALSARRRSGERWSPIAAENLVLDELVFASGASASGAHEGHGASKAVGRPDVWPNITEGGAGAWVPANPRGDWLEVSFPPTETRWIYVLETNGPGGIARVEDGAGQVLYDWKQRRREHTAFSPLRAQVLYLELPTPRTIDKLKITVDASQVREATRNGVRIYGRPEIDAVALGRAAPPPTVDMLERAQQVVRTFGRDKSVWDLMLDEGDSPDALREKGSQHSVWDDAFASAKTLFEDAPGDPYGDAAQQEIAKIHYWFVNDGGPSSWFRDHEDTREAWAKAVAKALEYAAAVTPERIAKRHWHAAAKGTLEAGLRIAPKYAAFLEGFGPDPQVAGAEAKIQAALKRIDDEYEAAIKAFNRLPPAIDAPELLPFAKLALEAAQADERVGKDVRGLRVVGPKKRYETEVSNLDERKLFFTGFELAVAEKDGRGRWWVTFITAGYFPENWNDENSPHHWSYRWVEEGDELHESVVLGGAEAPAVAVASTPPTDGAPAPAPEAATTSGEPGPQPPAADEVAAPATEEGASGLVCLLIAVGAVVVVGGGAGVLGLAYLMLSKKQAAVAPGAPPSPGAPPPGAPPAA